MSKIFEVCIAYQKFKIYFYAMTKQRQTEILGGVLFCMGVISACCIVEYFLHQKTNNMITAEEARELSHIANRPMVDSLKKVISANIEGLSSKGKRSYAFLWDQKNNAWIDEVADDLKIDLMESGHSCEIVRGYHDKADDMVAATDRMLEALSGKTPPIKELLIKW